LNIIKNYTVINQPFGKIMSQLVLESDNEQTLKLIQQLAEQLNIHCQFILQKTKSTPTKQDEINNAIEFVKTFSQEKTSFGDALNVDDFKNITGLQVVNPVD
jgi:ADP-dependent phosphofructokinase/glucokinase